MQFTKESLPKIPKNIKNMTASLFLLATLNSCVSPEEIKISSQVELDNAIEENIIETAQTDILRCETNRIAEFKTSIISLRKEEDNQCIFEGNSVIKDKNPNYDLINNKLTIDDSKMHLHQLSSKLYSKDAAIEISIKEGTISTPVFRFIDDVNQVGY